MGTIRKNNKINKIIVILGPTASGKTSLSIKLAKKFNGEIISADSRQVYKGMDIGTGKITKKEMEGIPHYLLDVSNPKKRFTVSDYKKLADKAINKIFKKGKIPFIVGGTGFYIQSITDGFSIPQVEPDWNFRKKLEKQSAEKLFEKLEKIDPKRAENIDRSNKRRLIRAIEIVAKTKKPVPEIINSAPPFKILFIGIKKSKEELDNLIKIRLLERIESGMINEAKKLKKSGVSFKRMEELGLEYRYMALYLQKKITYEEFISRLQKEIEHYAKKQMVWFKRDKRIKWIKNCKEAEKLAKTFLK